MKKDKMETLSYRALGIMSGTSLDGLDLVLAEFNGRPMELASGSEAAQNPIKWNYSIVKAQTLPYSKTWKEKLLNVKDAGAEAYFVLHHLYGQYIAAEVRAFLEGLEAPDLVASHGHTVFHHPEEGFSTQIGCGATIAAETGLRVVCDFRTLDTALGGQGAPLVPYGDQHLFADYESCLNIGGIANISYTADNGLRTAFDIGIANMALNHFAQHLGHPYDKGGQIARSTKVDTRLLDAWNNLPYYHTTGVKSMGREWFEAAFLPAASVFQLSTETLLATATEHVALQIAALLNARNIGSVLVTGGGAYNTFLIERIRAHYKGRLIIPDAHTIEFKEALIFAFLGVLRYTGQINTLKSVTGACRDSSGGAIYNG